MIRSSLKRSVMLSGCIEPTHDYIRHGTTTLFAALDIATGSVLKMRPPFGTKL